MVGLSFSLVLASKQALKDGNEWGMGTEKRRYSLDSVSDVHMNKHEYISIRINIESTSQQTPRLNWP